MADAKWITELIGEMPSGAAARRVLEVRLRAVIERLPAALENSADDSEHVHQLRVCTRRAGAALRIFDDCLPEKAAKRLRKNLRTMRRAAGGARDWDVFLEMIAGRAARAKPEQKPGLDFLVGYGQARRALAQHDLHELGPKTAAEFPEFVRDILDKIDPNRPREPLRDRAVPLLADLTKELEVAAAGDLTDYERLHAVRILGKQLRYAMELFAVCFDDEFRETRYPAIVEMQDILGRANDSRVAVDRLLAIKAALEKTRSAEWARYKLGIENVIRFHQRRLPEARRQFLAWRARNELAGKL